jgi:hypothetical protein
MSTAKSTTKKTRTACPLCKLSHLMDELRKHSNPTNLRAVRLLADAVYEHEGFDQICEAHMSERYHTMQMIEHWYYRMQWIIENNIEHTNGVRVMAMTATTTK